MSAPETYETGIRTAIYDYLRLASSLTGADGATGLLGRAEDPSLYPHGAPARASFPYVVMKRSDEPAARTLSKTRDGLTGSVWTFEVWGDDAFVVERVVEKLRARLEDIPGSRGNVSVRMIELQGEVDDAVRPEDGSEVTWFVTVLTARLIYRAVSTGA